MSQLSAAGALRTGSTRAPTWSSSRAAQRITGACWSRSPSGAPVRTSTGSLMSSGPPWPASASRWGSEVSTLAERPDVDLPEGGPDDARQGDVLAPVPGSAGGAPLQSERARTIFQKGAAGRRAFVCPSLDVPAVDPQELLPASLRRVEPAGLPELSEPEIVRHYVALSKRNFDL